MTETLTQEAAKELARIIEGRWAGKVNCWVEYMNGSGPGHDRHYAVRSDMLDGMPLNPKGEDWHEDFERSFGKGRGRR